MKTRIRVAFTVDMTKMKLWQLCRELETQFEDLEQEEVSLKTEDVHIVARCGGETIVELGTAPEVQP